MVSTVDLKLEGRRFVSEYQKVAFEMRNSSNLVFGCKGKVSLPKTISIYVTAISGSTCKKYIYEKI